MFFRDSRIKKKTSQFQIEYYSNYLTIFCFFSIGANSHSETCVGKSDGAPSSNLKPASQRKMSRNKFRQKARNQKKKQERKERGGPFKTKFLGVKK